MVMAKTVEMSMLITEKKPLTPQAQGRDSLSISFNTSSPWGNGTPIKNPRGAIINKVIKILVTTGKIIK